jgi:16S rRNA (cytosine1402-N4)-methyltransferase
VLLAEMLAALSPAPGAVFIDATFGAGGYSRAILAAADCRVLAFDRDLTAVSAADPICREFAGRLTLVNEPFSRLEELGRIEAAPRGQPPVQGPFADGVVLDIGVSSMQIDQPERGFSFQADGPLDMRMSADGATAADLVNGLSETALADVFFHYGEERRSRAIARAIGQARAAGPITTTRGLTEIVTRVLGPPRGDAKHPATRVFQALRIAVNDELGELAAALAAAERALVPGGRLVVVTFHSLEDRIVKRYLQRTAGEAPAASRHAPPQASGPPPSFQIVNHRPVTAAADELEVNPRARSAKLRSAVRTSAPAIGAGPDDLGLPRVSLSYERGRRS